LIGGPQGAGLETSMQLLANAFAKRGYGIVSDREYHSNIKGRHSYITLRASATSLPKALRETVQIIGAMDPETVFTHFNELEEGGYLIYDSSQADKSVHTILSMPPQAKKRIIEQFEAMGVEGTLSSLITYLTTNRRIVAVEIDFPHILTSLSTRFALISEQASRYVSSILFGAMAGLVDIDDDCVRYCIVNRFAGREKVVEQNLSLVRDVSDLTKAAYGVPCKLKPSRNHQQAFILGKGNDIVAMGKILGGLRYQSYYPITPAADESFFLEAHERLPFEGENGGIVVLQTEDELAAITSAIGAALTGVRSATATSGPGFSLMVEGLGWAGINEVPVVITYYQRSGPSTGQATRGSQADLLSVLFASHGEFPRLVLASGDHEEAFNDAFDAFNLAERYQVPVIHLLDKFLANSIVTMPLPDLSRIRIERGELVDNPGEGYKRFDLTKTVSPRARLGSNAVIGHSGSEHDEWGRSSEDPVNRRAMNEKRMKKLELADAEIPAERRAIYYGPDDAGVLLVGWGYVKMVAAEALTELNAAGYTGAYLHLKMFSPFPSQYVASIIDRFPPNRVITLEYNYQAQAAMAVKLYSGKEVTRRIVKYTGRPMYLNEVVEAVKRMLETDVRRVVLTRGS
jgi:2-oxoglutarate ferredoxin oxidoreductase subunit alpha